MDTPARELTLTTGIYSKRKEFAPFRVEPIYKCAWCINSVHEVTKFVPLRKEQEKL